MCSSYIWIHTTQSCGSYFQTMQIGIVSRLWLRKRSWRFKIWTSYKGNFTRDEWIHLPTVCSDTMSRIQQESREEQVTTRSRLMKNLIARMPSVVWTSTSVSPGKINCGNHNLWRSDRSGLLMDVFQQVMVFSRVVKLRATNLSSSWRCSFRGNV